MLVDDSLTSDIKNQGNIFLFDEEVVIINDIEKALQHKKISVLRRDNPDLRIDCGLLEYQLIWDTIET